MGSCIEGLSRSLPIWLFCVPLVSQLRTPMSFHIQHCQWNCWWGYFQMNLLHFHSFVCIWTECKWCQFYYLLHKMFPSQGQVKGRKYRALPQVPQGQLATSISRSQTPALLKSWGRFRWDVWKSSIHYLLTVHLRTLKCQVVAWGQVGFVSPHTDGWLDHLHWIIPLVCEPFSKWWIRWELLPYICWTLL